MNTTAAITELTRRIDNLLRIGTVAEVKGDSCRVKTGELLTQFRPFFTRRAGKAKTSWRPTVGEQVMLLSLSGDLTNAYILPALYSDENPEPDDNNNRERTVYPDGAVIEYDPDTSALTVKGIKTATVQASERVTIDCQNSEFTGNVLVKKKLTVEQGAKVTGAIDHSGKLTNNGGMAITGGANIDGINFGTHKHGGVDTGPGTSGGPQ
ncbi:phage baseplate assembly protein V [Shewanella sp. SM34]|uniref:phage baseplate assembly protein V n=1 Tax=unclassified Shewanella TaxID=196818 RepID=UPI0021D9BB01|nr:MULTISPECIES: phage baseplate assembly protein V [unclassified Shewanella]MCU8055388.1 phage baseplate assembly protein V [Shewanella sp. SM35]MCU8064310.1 phage baseplate assembly protein V [Shewanella sp. SM34]